MNLNKVILIGRTTEKPALKQTQSGFDVSSFSLATSRVWSDKQGQKQEETEFHRIVVWGKTAMTVAQYVEKGQLLMVEGRLQTRQWEDKGGVKKYSTEIIAERVQFGPRAQGKPKEQYEGEPLGSNNSVDTLMEEMPF